MILNTFPDLLTFSMLSPFILRVVLGIIVINLGLLKLGKEKIAWQKLFETINLVPPRIFVKILAFIELIGGIILVMGAYTQLTAIILSVLFFCEAVLEYREPSLERRNLTFYILIFTISLSLVFLGAGAFAFDLPL
jgi:putative oxidoreductase